MIRFVNSSNGQTNDFLVVAKPDDKSKQLMDNLRHNAQQWATLLGATGGASELSKCSYHVVWWHSTKQGTPSVLRRTRFRRRVGDGSNHQGGTQTTVPVAV